MVGIKPGVWSGHAGPMKSSKKQNNQAKVPTECKYMEKTATLFGNISRQLPGWNNETMNEKQKRSRER